MRYRCHQCFALVDVEDLAHVDLYFDLCWLQCTTCAAAFGAACGMDSKVNPHRHGYLECPLRDRLDVPVDRQVPRPRVVI